MLQIIINVSAGCRKPINGNSTRTNYVSDTHISVNFGNQILDNMKLVTGNGLRNNMKYWNKVISILCSFYVNKFST